MDEYEIDDKTSSIPFTARLMAYYRAIESTRENALITDPFAERLAGDMESYFNKHRRARGTGDYTIVRTHYIDNYLLASWCNEHKESQIVLFGAGLDARAYRFEPLKHGRHRLFEIDFDLINKYKSSILKDETPLCELVRVSADISELRWITDLEKTGFSHETPTFWLLEGLVYYIDQIKVESILKTTSTNCPEESQMFADVCVPGLSLAQFGPFMTHFKWGLNKEDVPAFFARTGWNVVCAFADDYDQGRDVGQRGLIFVNGKRDLSLLDILENTISEDAPVKKIPPEFESLSINFLRDVIAEVHVIVESYKGNPDDGMVRYLQFINRVKPTVEIMMKSFSEPLSIGHISSRLLRDPATVVLHTPDEKEAHIVGYLKALMFLGFCVAKGIAGEHLSSMNIYIEGQKINKINQLCSLVQIIQQEIGNS